MRAVALAREGGPRPTQIVTPAAVENAPGAARDRRLDQRRPAPRRDRRAGGIEVPLQRFNELSEETPVLVDLKPTGPHYMEDLFAAGGLGASAARAPAGVAPGGGIGHGRDAQRTSGG